MIKKEKKKKKIDKAKVEMKLAQTMHQLRKGDKKRKRKSDRDINLLNGEEEKKIIKVTEFMSVYELADRLDETPNEIISKCLSFGILVTINQRLDIDMITAVADDYGFDVELLEEWGDEIIEEEDIVEEEMKEISERSPVVSVMGHVDHGKTSLLDYIRKSQIAKKEAGAITQHIKAYEVKHNEKKITFLDTPGHELFTAMRARGAQLTDICILVIAANDGVKPQTVEAIDHVKAANVPIIVAINKVDLPVSNPQKVKQQLLEKSVMVEEFGGKVQCINISALTGEGIPDLLDAIILEADIMELKSSFSDRAKGTIIEASLEKGRGMVADVLITQGTLRTGDSFIAGSAYGKVKAMFNEYDSLIKKVGPSQPVKIMGFDKLPEIGDTFVVISEERKARDIARKRGLVEREQQSKIKKFTLDNLKKSLEAGEITDLNIVLKCDVGGSLEALSDGLSKLPQEEVKINIIHKAIGPVTENDVLLAKSSKAIVIAYNVGLRPEAAKLSVSRNVDIKTYNIIFEAIDSVKKAMSGMLEPEYEEVIIGKAEIREVYKVPKIGFICGSYIYEGEIRRGLMVRVKRDKWRKN